MDLDTTVNMVVDTSMTLAEYDALLPAADAWFNEQSALTFSWTGAVVGFTSYSALGGTDACFCANSRACMCMHASLLHGQRHRHARTCARGCTPTPVSRPRRATLT